MLMSVIGMEIRGAQSVHSEPESGSNKQLPAHRRGQEQLAPANNEIN